MRTKNHSLPWRRVIIMGILALFAVGAAIMAHPVSARTTVRVAYFDLGDYYVTKDGELQSFDKEYLKEIAKYCDYDFTYVDCGTWENALVMLDAHQVDLVGTMQWNSTRETQYEFCLQPYGYTTAEIVGDAQSKMVYEDYDAIGNSKIGVVEDYVRRGELNDKLKENNINPTIVPYPNQAALEAALASGQVDLISANSHALPKDLKVVERFGSAPFFFASWSGNSTLTDQLDAAIMSLNLNQPEVQDRLIGKYFPELIRVPYSKAEYDLAAEKTPYTLYLKGNGPPLSYVEDDEVKGIIAEVIDQLADSTGLSLNVAERTDDSPMDADTTMTYITTIASDVAPNAVSEGQTNAFLTEDYNFFSRNDGDASLDTATIVVARARNGLKEYLTKNYPNAKIEELESPNDCILAVADKKADYTLLNVHVGAAMCIANGVNNVDTIPTKPIEFGFYLQFKGENKATLAAMVNKGIDNLDTKAINDATLKEIMNTKPLMTPSAIIRRNPFSALIIGTVVVGLLAIMVIAFVYARVMRKERDFMSNVEQERAGFFARMSHDMRTPMNGILGMTALSKNENDLAVLHKNIEHIESSGQYLLQLVNDVLDLNKAESGKMTLEYSVVKSGDLVEQLMQMVQINADRKNITLELINHGIDTEQYIRVDAVRIKQVFVNIMGNAIKFTPEGGHIRFIMERQNTRDGIDYNHYIIEDNGVGMSQQFIDNGLFNAYSQEFNALTSKVSGSGLGMAITRILLNLMGGSIEVESTEGKGSTFIIKLGVERAEAPADTKASMGTEETDTTARLQGHHVLLCEDHPLNAEITKRLLDKVKMTVTWAENGKLGLEEYQTNADAYDAVLMDVRMPVMDGLEASRHIREYEKKTGGHIPIIAMTANAYAEDKAAVAEAGMDAHLTKPVSPTELYKVLGEWMSKTADTTED